MAADLRVEFIEERVGILGSEGDGALTKIENSVIVSTYVNSYFVDQYTGISCTSPLSFAIVHIHELRETPPIRTVPIFIFIQIIISPKRDRLPTPDLDCSTPGNTPPTKLPYGYVGPAMSDLGTTPGRNAGYRRERGRLVPFLFHGTGACR